MHAGCMDLPRVLTTSSSSWMKMVKSNQALVVAAVKVEEDPREERYKSILFSFDYLSVSNVLNNVLFIVFFADEALIWKDTTIDSSCCCYTVVLLCDCIEIFV